MDTEARGKSSAGDRTPVAQSVVRHYTDEATPAPNLIRVIKYEIR
jgi:hypothetical protein